MIKDKKGITLISLVITIVLIIIMASIVIPMSLERFEVNNINKMLNDLNILKEKVSNYYMQHGSLPILKENKYTYTSLDFNTDAGDNENYYILDLSAIGDISLNYGKKGYENPNESDDVYIINEATHTIYYVKGIELDGEKYYRVEDTGKLEDTIPPSSPEIKLISGAQNDKGLYLTEVELEIIPGRDSWSGIKETTYSVKKDGTEINTGTIASNEEGNIIKLSENGVYYITAASSDNKDNVSKETKSDEIEVHIEHDWEDWNINPAPTCITEGKQTRICKNSRCGAFETETLPPLGHAPEDPGTYYSGNCITKGKTIINCTRCGILLEEIEDEEYGPHGETKEVDDPGNCITLQSTKTICTLCNQTLYTTEGDEYGPHGETYKYEFAGNCVTRSTIQYICSICGDVLSEEEGDYGAHVWGETTVSGGYNCESQYKFSRACTICGTDGSYLGDYGEHQYANTWVSIGSSYKHLVENKCNYCGNVSETFYEWHWPLNAWTTGQGVYTGWFTCHCGASVETTLSHTNMAALLSACSAETTYRYWWQYQGYTEEDLEGGYSSGGNTISMLRINRNNLK